MKAVVIHGYGGPGVLRYEACPGPVPSVGEVLVRVAASSVNPFDFEIRSGSLKDFIPLTSPAILGLDVSGIVESVSPGVTTFARGDKAFARASQTYASMCAVTPDRETLLAMAEAVQKGTLSIPL
jgi:NADPH:quinone reductase-like Zn-dependent oxidoreductase